MSRRVLKWTKRALAGALALLLAGCGTGGTPQQGRPDMADGVPVQSGADSVQEPGGRPAPEEAGKPEVKEERQDAWKNQAETLEDGIYTVTFETDSSMFHLNESCEGRARLTVEGGAMTVHVPLVSKSIVNLFSGTAGEARCADESAWLHPVTETVSYSDGYTEEVYAFDVPVPSIGVEFELAIIGTKGKWYDHKVCVTDPEPAS